MYIVIGAGGYLGSYVVKNILALTEDKVLALGRHLDTGICSITDNTGLKKSVRCMKCDITNSEDLKVLNDELACVRDVKAIYLAAYHRPDDVRKNPQEAWNTNVTALSNALNIMTNISQLLYISTEMVYGEGEKGHRFTEEDRTAPVNLYGIQKKVAEAVVLGYGHHAVRLPFLIGPSLVPDRKHFYDVIVDTLKEGREIGMFADAYKSALDFDTAARLLVQLCEIGLAGVPHILNVCGDDDLSKYEIAMEVAQKHRLDGSLIKPIGLHQDTSIFRESRASYALMDNHLLKETLRLDAVRMKF